jgi:glucose/mannose-6-phosphate isomerase
MMEQSILSFAKQFEYEPVIENESALVRKSRVIVCGMGGSHLAADLFSMRRPEMPITVHKDYGLPMMSESDMRESMIVASSYSGNTEESLSAFEEALERKLPLIAIAGGGKLIERAKETGTAYIQLPDMGIQPRVALGLAFRALAVAVGDIDALEESNVLADTLHPDKQSEDGKALSVALAGRVPVIYSSRRNEALAYNWKIKFNETGKIPAFHNVFPELNHNEMTGFDVIPSTKSLAEKFHVILLEDAGDDPRILKRMRALETLYAERGVPVTSIVIVGADPLEKIFSCLITADWTAYYTGLAYGAETEQVPMVESFKRLIS